MKNKSLVRRLLGITPVVLMSGAAQAFAQSPTFTTQSYRLAGNTQVAADFNGNGKLDIAASGLQGGFGDAE
jgi:hypothetical protein